MLTDSVAAVNLSIGIWDKAEGDNSRISYQQDAMYMTTVT